jgi:hypothetical protein
MGVLKGGTYTKIKAADDLLHIRSLYGFAMLGFTIYLKCY